MERTTPCSMHLSSNPSDFVQFLRFNKRYNIAAIRLCSALHNISNIDLELISKDEDSVAITVEKVNACISRLKMSIENERENSTKEAINLMLTFLFRVNDVLILSPNLKSVPKSMYLHVFKSFSELCGLECTTPESSSGADELRALSDHFCNSTHEYNLLSSSSNNHPAHPVGNVVYTKQRLPFIRNSKEKSDQNFHSTYASDTNNKTTRTSSKIGYKDSNALSFVSGGKDRNTCASVTNQSNCDQTNETATTSNDNAGCRDVTYDSCCPFRKRTIEGRIKQPAVKLSHPSGIVSNIPIIITLAPDNEDEDEDRRVETCVPVKEDEVSKPTSSFPRIAHPSFKAPCLKLNVPTVKLSAGVRSAMEQEFAFPVTATETRPDYHQLPFPIIVTSSSDGKRSKLEDPLECERANQGDSSWTKMEHGTNGSLTESRLESASNATVTPVLQEQDHGHLLNAILGNEETEGNTTNKSEFSNMEETEGNTTNNSTEFSNTKSNENLSKRKTMLNNGRALKWASSVVKKYKRNKCRGKTPRKNLENVAIVKVNQLCKKKPKPRTLRKTAYQRKKNQKRKNNRANLSDLAACQKTQGEKSTEDTRQGGHDSDSGLEMYIVQTTSGSLASSASVSSYKSSRENKSFDNYQLIRATPENSVYSTRVNPLFWRKEEQEDHSKSKVKIQNNTRHQKTVDWLIEQHLNDLSEPEETDFQYDGFSVGVLSSENWHSSNGSSFETFTCTVNKPLSNENLNASSQDYKPLREFIEFLQCELDKDRSGQQQIGFLLHKTYVVIVVLNRKYKFIVEACRKDRFVTYSPVLNLLCASDRKFLAVVLLRLAYLNQ